MIARPRCVVCGDELAKDTTCCIRCLPPRRVHPMPASSQRALELWRARMDSPPAPKETPHG